MSLCSETRPLSRALLSPLRRIAHVVASRGALLRSSSSAPLAPLAPLRRVAHVGASRGAVLRSSSSAAAAAAAANAAAVARAADAASAAERAASSAAAARAADALVGAAWAALAASRPVGEASLVFPRSIVWLAGAPGAGKGTNAAAIKKERDIAHIFEVSSLLSTPVFKAKKEAGELIGDADVISAVLGELLKPAYADGVIVDGFPRTVTQAHAMVALKARMAALHEASRGTPALRSLIPRPDFRVVVLYCSEAESVKRQLRRGEELQKQNKVAADTGVGRIVAARSTDVDADAARKRYQIFMGEVYDSLQAIKSQFPFYFVNADAPPDAVRRSIAEQLHYVSRTDLSPEAYELVHSVDSAGRVVQQARTRLVQRLNAYSSDYPALAARVVELLKAEFFRIIKRQALAGRCVIRSNSALLEDPIALNMLLDVLAERGFRVVLDVMRERVPVVVDPVVPGDSAGARIRSRDEKTFVFTIEFEAPSVRWTEPEP